jgi:8-oxo-dGDP phosphatase
VTTVEHAEAVEPAETGEPAETVEGQAVGGQPAGTGHRYEVADSQVAYQGKVFAVRRDLVVMPGGEQVVRDVLQHPGAVGVVALDDADRVVLLRQYRHPVRQSLWELPAGLLDVRGEPASVGAARELAEEARLVASDWHVLVDVLASPGMTDEAYRVFLARGISDLPAADDQFVRVHEESEIVLERVDLDEAVARVQRGEISNAMAVIGVLAADRARRDGYASLRPVDEPWPARPDNAG